MKKRIYFIVIPIVTALTIISGFVGIKYRNRIIGLGRKYHLQVLTISTGQNDKVTNEFDEFFKQWKVYGIDVSKYQGKIKWSDVNKIFDEHKIHFAFIRATYGKDIVDTHFLNNWDAKKDTNILCGAYHYYVPDQNALQQARNFINNVTLKEGNLPPVVDIETRPKSQSMASFKIGLQTWLDTVEKHYGVKPIIYSGSTYYSHFLHEEFKGYTLWVANYRKTKTPVEHPWDFWQYSDNGKAAGINGDVDINVYKGNYESLKELCLKNRIYRSEEI